MLIRPRKSRIYYLRKFFDYPIKLTGTTLKNLGAARTVRVGVSYLQSRMKQIAPEKSLEDFLINRFGRELYLTFFKSYTEKVWGTPCNEISAEWGAQRIKGLSLTTAVKHFVKKVFEKKQSGSGDVCAEGHGYEPDRTVHVSEVWAGAALGACRGPGGEAGRRDPHGLEGCGDPSGWKDSHECYGGE